jgi:hypothetical protein
MGRIFDAVEEFLKSDDWPTQAVEDASLIKTGFDGDSGQFSCFASARDAQDQLVFYSVFPVKAPVDQRAQVAEFITRANYGMAVGNFEMDFADGEVRFKTSFDVEGMDLPAKLVRNLVYANVLTMDRYFPGLMRVLYAGASAEEAVHEIEDPAG